jgi:hypothetical protein
LISSALARKLFAEVAMSEHDVIDRAVQQSADSGNTWDACALSMTQIEDLQRVCERWYAEREGELIRSAKGKYIAISYFDQPELLARGLGHIAKNWPSDARPYVVGSKALDVFEQFEAQYGVAGSYGAPDR